LDQIPAALRPTITHFTTDMWEGYVNAIEEFIAANADVTARLVIDRFHVAQQYRDDFDDLRKQELKRLKKELPQETYAQACQGTLWLLRKNHTHLDEQEKSRLRRLFVLSPQLHLAYTFREELTAIFNQAQTRSEGERRLTRWIQKVQLSALDGYDGFIKTLRNHWNPILN
jgi:transposase